MISTINTTKHQGTADKPNGAPFTEITIVMYLCLLLTKKTEENVKEIVRPINYYQAKCLMKISKSTFSEDLEDVGKW